MRVTFGQALPMRVFQSEPPAGVHQSTIWREGDVICVRLARRKNAPSGSGIMRRACTCKGSRLACPVHALWEQHFAALPEGTAPWEGMTGASALRALRTALEKLSVRKVLCAAPDASGLLAGVAGA